VHYLQTPADAGRGQGLVAVVSLGNLNSPDEVHVLEVQLDGHRLDLHVRIRSFGGALAANVQQFALVVIDLGVLPPGGYHVELKVEHHVFTEYDHPETARFDRTSSHHLKMEIKPDAHV
jgi:hypothetical protein